jgi:hypothetical protein
MPYIQVSDELYDAAQSRAELGGFEDVDAFVASVLAAELWKRSPAAQEPIENFLQDSKPSAGQDVRELARKKALEWLEKRDKPAEG